eukprot:TRINITY_DN25900_c0_g1_i1.p1 TRINITY_DN25900_c0_g1~~TRINITY_DN25900_c0_g1_i1.p1  ORF type:complete len:426 (+),score=72.08 TRINITY_DN25900_c0_g1_i1:91-1368(+)
MLPYRRWRTPPGRRRPAAVVVMAAAVAMLSLLSACSWHRLPAAASEWTSSAVDACFAAPGAAAVPPVDLPAKGDKRNSFVFLGEFGYSSSRACGGAILAVGAGAGAYQARRRLPLIMLALLVLQKCATDGLTWYTRAYKVGGGFSASTAAFVGEILKFPVLAVAISIARSPGAVLTTFRDAVTKAPLLNCWMGAAYAGQNLLYFYCLENISATVYQVLSQSKLIFTAVLMTTVLGRSFSQKGVFALGLLCVGAVLTQIGEMGGGAAGAASRGNVLLGCGLTVLSAFISALPNVWYERILKGHDGKKQDEWVANVQLTFWIFFWVLVAKVCEGTGELGLVFGEGLAGLFTGFTPLVWAIVCLQTTKCILIPACLKYADNILVCYTKPVSIALMMLYTAVVTEVWPSPLMLFGGLLVVISLAIYESK